MFSPQIFVDWLQQTAMGKQNTLRLNPSDQERRKNQEVGVGGSKEGSGEGSDDGGEVADEGADGFNEDDTPLTWAEVRKWVHCFETRLKGNW